jgi:hypothetical protein
MMENQRQKKEHEPYPGVGQSSARVLAAVASTAFDLWHLKPAAPRAAEELEVTVA